MTAARGAPATPSAGRLVARTIELDAGAPVDLLAVAGDGGYLFEHEGAGVAGRGVALRLDLPEGLDGAAGVAAVTEALASIECDDEVTVAGSGPLAIGALPFSRKAAGSMVVPALVVGRSADGRQWLTTVGVGAAPRPPLTALACAPRPASLPDGFSLTSPRPHAEFRGAVADAVAAIADDRFDKVVVAREVLVEANRPIVVVDILERLRALYPACMVFSVDGFVGASPELLVERRGDLVRSHPLAGTHARSGDPHADAAMAAWLLASVKDRREHRFVIDAIADALLPLCARLDVPDSPDIVHLRNVMHLGTEITGRLRHPAPSALEVVSLLHPTPAVGGTPRPEALDWLAAHEGLERGRYAGPVGWMDASGDGTFAIGIRSAEIVGSQARLFAGVGVVEGSDPGRELVETQLKLQALLAAVVRP